MEGAPSEDVHIDCTQGECEYRWREVDTRNGIDFTIEVEIIG